MDLYYILGTIWRVTCYILIFLLCGYVFLKSWFLGLEYVRTNLGPIPPNLPWVGLKDVRFFPKLRAALRELSTKRTVIEEGYDKYSKHDKPFILPTLHWPVVVLPPSQTRWLVSQPDNVFSTIAVQDDLIGTAHFGHGPDSAAVHDFSVISRDLTRNMGRLTPILLEEIARSCQREFGSDGWKDVELAKVVAKIAAEAVSRAVIGNELAENTEYNARLHVWEMGFGYATLVFGQWCPRWLKPLAGTILALPLSLLKWRFGRIVLPEIKARLRQVQTRGAEEKSTKNDLLQWVIESAARDPDPRVTEVDNVLGRMMLYNMFAQHTTQNTASTLLFDLLSYPSGQQSLPELAEEAEVAFSNISEDPYATRQMLKLDSTIRESMRLNPMFAKGTQREVVKPGGMNTPDGLFLPRGCHVSSASVSCIQRDPNFYSDGNDFVPFRFYTEHKDGNKQQAASHASDLFMSFSIGRHACPGRFFAVHLLKLMLGYILLNYEFQPLPERPDFVTFGDLTMPPATKVKARQRRVKDL